MTRLPWLIVHGAIVWKLALPVFIVGGAGLALLWARRRKRKVAGSATPAPSASGVDSAKASAGGGSKAPEAPPRMPHAAAVGFLGAVAGGVAFPVFFAAVGWLALWVAARSRSTRFGRRTAVPSTARQSARIRRLAARGRDALPPRQRARLAESALVVAEARCRRDPELFELETSS